MPELPDVEIFKHVLDQHARGRVVARVSVPDPGSLEGATAATLQRRLKGRRLSSSSRHGKVLFAGFEDAATLAMHFGTNGSLQHVPSDAKEPPSTRLSFEFTDGNRLAYLNPRRIGHVHVTKDAASYIAEERLGPDALDAGVRCEDALAEALANRRQAIKAVLMDQARIAGHRQHLRRRDPVPGTAASRRGRGDSRARCASPSVRCDEACAADRDRPRRRCGELHRQAAEGVPAARAPRRRPLPTLRRSSWRSTSVAVAQAITVRSASRNLVTDRSFGRKPEL